MHELDAHRPAGAVARPAELPDQAGRAVRGRPLRLLTAARLAAAAVAVSLAVAACTGQARSSARRPPPPSATVANPAQAQPACSNTQVVAGWSVRRRAAQLVVVPADEGNVAAARPMVAAGAGGVILFGSAAPPSLRHDLAALARAAPGRLGPLVMTDEEGGAIQRMANVTGSLPWPRTMAATMTAAQVRVLARAAARRMRAAGVTVDLAPVLGLSGGPGPSAASPVGARSFSASPRVAGAYGVAFARGLLDGGVTPVVKHFPGLGQASYNTDYGPASVPPLPVLEKAALLPFQAAIRAGLPAVMVSDAAVPGLTHGLPVSLSAPAVTGLLRHRLGFRGLVITDSLSVPAVQSAGYSVPRATAKAIEAGADMVLYDTPGPAATMAQMVTAIARAARSGRLPASRLDDAVTHVLAAKHVSLCR